MMKLKADYDDVLIINEQNTNHHNNEIKRLNDRYFYYLSLFIIIININIIDIKHCNHY